ncbi:MAG: geranylgeranylglycerol-phosphate geranylgeranyltransferase [Bacteroidota bacterium]
MGEKKSTITLFFKLVRYPNLLIMAATQVFAAFCLSTEPFSPFTNAGFIFTLLATILIAAGGYIINDIFDAAADGVNKPDKTFITPTNRNFYAQTYYGLSVVGILLGLAANMFVGVICTAMAVLLYLYSYRLKKTVLLGNIAVAFMSAVTPGILMYVLPNPDRSFIILYAGFAFITTLVREAVKDIEDEEGDRTAGYATLPVVYGEGTAKKVTALLAAAQIALLLAFAVWCLVSLRLWAFYYLIALVTIPSVGLGLLIFWAKDKDHYSQASLLCKLIMIMGIASMYLVN